MTTITSADDPSISENIITNITELQDMETEFICNNRKFK